MTSDSQQPDQSSAVPSLFDPAVAANPYPLFVQMRAHGPVISIEVPYAPPGTSSWLVTRFAGAVQALRDTRLTVDATALDPNTGIFGQANTQGAEEMSFLGAKTMLSTDGIEHSRLRGLVGKAFTPQYIETLRPRIQQFADALLDQVQAQGSMDIVRDYAYPLPINVISEMLGVPDEHKQQMQLWAEALISPDPEHRAQLRAYSAYVQRLIAEKSQQPGNDLISQLVQMEEGGNALNESELLATVGLLIFAGHDTTSNLIGIGTLMLLDHPEQLAALQADPSLIPAAVEELLRYNGPVFSTAPRYALEDLELGGQQIRRGDMVLVAVSSANHDESEFNDAEELDIARSISRHLAFGQGIHFCLGAPLARLEGEIAFATLLRRMPDLKLAVPREQVAWRENLQLRGLKALPVVF